ncbi:MAG: rhomboid family intramembrane serine protease [Nibricoccus sp.]
MRDDYPQNGRSVLTWLLCAIAAGFILEAIFQRMFASMMFTDWFQLTVDGLKHGFVWKLVSYSFVHPLEDILSVMSVALNMLCLYFIGREMEGLLGTRHFLVLYFGAVLCAAGTWLLVNFNRDGALAGTWPIILACLTLYSLINPAQEKRILLMFVPVTVRPKYILIGLFLFDLIVLVFGEMRDKAIPLHYAPSAHLGGMLAGCLYYFLIHKREWQNPDGRSEIELPRWMRRSRKATVATAGKYKVNIAPKEDIKGEIDRILDKINSFGFNSLTPEERKLLDQARDRLGRND